MSEPLALIDYEQLTLAELEAAAKSPTLKERCAHLDQAAAYAAAGEEARRRDREGIASKTSSG